MNLNFIFFPVPKKKYTKDQHKGELIWLPKLIYEQEDNKENQKTIKPEYKAQNQSKQQFQHKRCQSQVFGKTDHSYSSINKNNTTNNSRSEFNSILSTRVSFYRQPIKKSDEMDKSYIEAETFIIHNDEIEDYNLDQSQEGNIMQSVQTSIQTKLHSKKEMNQQVQTKFNRDINITKTTGTASTINTLQQSNNYIDQNKLYIPLSRDCINESFQSCSLLQEGIDEINLDQYQLQSPKNIQNYITTTFLGSNNFSSQFKASHQASHSSSISGNIYQQESNQSINHNCSVVSFNQYESVNSNNIYSGVQLEGKTSMTNREPFRQIQNNNNKLINYTNSTRQFNSPTLHQPSLQKSKIQNNYFFNYSNQNASRNQTYNNSQSSQSTMNSPQPRVQNSLLKDQHKQKQFIFSNVQNQMQNMMCEQSYRFCQTEKQKYIPCLFLKSQQPSNYILIYFHGNGEDISLSYELTDHLRRCLKINVLAVEYQGYGIYEGETDENQILKDTLYIYNFLTQKLNYNSKNIIVLGRSIGTGPATWLAANKKVGSLILISPFTSIRAVVKHVAGSIAQHLIKERFVNIENIQNVGCPTFIVHGQLDKLIPYQQSQQLHDYCKGPCQLILPKKMTHVEIDFYEDLTNPLQTFFLKNGLNIRLDNSMLTYHKHIQIPKKLFEQPIIKKQQQYQC